MGNTCYINSFLQILFHINEMKRQILEIKNSNDKMIQELQQVFINLLFQEEAVDTGNLLVNCFYLGIFWLEFT
jgi:ubiquitin C-terminal hydrolase